MTGTLGHGIAGRDRGLGCCCCRPTAYTALVTWRTAGTGNASGGRHSGGRAGHTQQRRRAHWTGGGGAARDGSGAWARAVAVETLHQLRSNAAAGAKAATGAQGRGSRKTPRRGRSAAGRHGPNEWQSCGERSRTQTESERHEGARRAPALAAPLSQRSALAQGRAAGPARPEGPARRQLPQVTMTSPHAVLLRAVRLAVAALEIVPQRDVLRRGCGTARFGEASAWGP